MLDMFVVATGELTVLPREIDSGRLYALVLLRVEAERNEQLS